MSSNSRLDTLLLLIFTSSSSLLLLLAHVFNNIPTDPYGNFNGCHASLVITPLLMQLEWQPGLSQLPFQIPSSHLSNWDNQKCSPQADLLYVKSAGCAQLCPIQTENKERMFIFFKIFVITLTLFCSMVKLRKLKCTY